MIKRLHLKNFSCFEDQEVVFTDGRGTIKQKVFVVGENGSGKTALLESFAFIKKLTMGLLINDHLNHYNFKHAHSIEAFNLVEEVNGFKTIGFNHSMSLEYEFLINGDSLVYNLKFDDNGGLLHESLYKRTSRKKLMFYEYNKKTLEFGYGIILNKKEAWVRSLIEKHDHEYTLLGILSFAVLKNNIHVKEDLKNLINFIADSFVSVPGYFYGLDYYNFFLDIKLDGPSGIVDEYTKTRLKTALPLLNGLINYFYPHIEEIEIDTFKVDEDQFKMEICLKKKFRNEIVKICSDNFSNGFKNMIYLSYALLSMYEGKFVMVDDFTENVQYKTLEHLINSVMIEFEQQVIVSLNGLDALEIVDPNSIYIVHYRNGSHYIDSLSDIASIRANHNIRKRYIEGVYTEVPQYGKLPFREITNYRNDMDNLDIHNFTQNKYGIKE
ncbi:ATP/GTP-binding protein [Erysipelothrix urinaevulpis]|uniref:AAA family ATPase n=1 Tax=Erysipelothrix urinaevulpis TaxID=2683717 RepID=UPI00135BDCF1|nr:AAA family ATPase [Erysipelothrix urinaevulpis]